MLLFSYPVKKYVKLQECLIGRGQGDIEFDKFEVSVSRQHVLITADVNTEEVFLHNLTTKNLTKLNHVLLSNDEPSPELLYHKVKMGLLWGWGRFGVEGINCFFFGIF